MHRINTVVIPARSLNLTNLERAKLRFQKNDTTDDEYLEKLVIPACSGRANAYCKRIFVQQTYQDSFRFDGHHGSFHSDYGAWHHSGGRPAIVLRQAPIRNIESFAVDGVELTLDTDYEIDAKAGILYRIGGGRSFTTAQSFTKAVVRYVAGWDAPPCDTEGSLLAEAPQVEQAVLDMVLAAYAARKRDSMLREHGTPQAGQDAWWVGGLRLTPGAHGVPQGAADILDDFMLPSLR